MNAYEKAFRQAIRKRRLELELTGVECAKRMRRIKDVKKLYKNFTSVTWYSWEKATATGRTPPVAMLPAICQVLDLESPCDLLPYKVPRERTRKKKKAKLK